MLVWLAIWAMSSTNLATCPLLSAIAFTALTIPIISARPCATSSAICCARSRADWVLVATSEIAAVLCCSPLATWRRAVSWVLAPPETWPMALVA